MLHVSINMKEFEEQVKAYEEIRPIYMVFSDILTAILTRATKELGFSAIVQSRAKGIPNFAEKVIRTQGKYSDSVNEFPDLCGARVIVEHKDALDPVCDFIRKHFEIDESDTEDALMRLRVGEFGYRSVHFNVALKEGEFEDLINEMSRGTAIKGFRCLVKRLHERRTEMEIEKSKFRPGPKFKAEIQVRTLLQHAWAEFAHDRFYKSEFDVPRKWKRDASRISATLEEADDAFSRCIRGVETYKTYYGSYMTLEEREREKNILEAVAKYDPDDMRLAHKIARLCLSLEDWEMAEERLYAFVRQWEISSKGKEVKEAWSVIRDGSSHDEVERAELELERFKDPFMASVLLDLGLAKWHRRDLHSRDFMGWAIALDGQNLDAQVALAETFLDENAHKALECYEEAFQTAPSDPRVLGGFTQCKIISERNLEFIPMIRPSLEAGIETCQERAKVGVYLPHTYYDIGLFALLLSRPFESLTAYCKAVQLTDMVSHIENTLKGVEKILGAIQNKLLEQESIQFEQVRRFLLIAKAGKLLARAKAGREKDDADAVKSAQDQVEDAIRRCLKGLSTKNVPAIEGPVVIVAGGCDEGVEDRIQEFKGLLNKTFEGFAGTIFSGGTTSGISGLVGDLPISEKRLIRKIAFLPRSIPAWATRHDGYEFSYTDGSWFSALEPLYNWICLLTSGIDPSNVKLLGINGGKIAGFEFRLALTLGARVGIIRHSGRAASDIFEDEDWNDIPGLLELPNDPQTVEAFVQDLPTSRDLDPLDRETLARQMHEEFRRNQEQRFLTNDPAITDWQHLPPDLKHSNLHAVDHMEEKLRSLGLKMRKVEPVPVSTIKFSEEQIETMAEMEHGRWNVERLLSGWTLGERDVEKKKSPYLVSWAELPDEIREYDRQAVRKIPEILRNLGYEIVPG